ncbi:AAA family ATPase [uncultured Megasphaera sp.]|uniref:AAA family ATPase n=1 Tax=uncultured Megasphaera sp. TaxID=165188 RepID=UPI00265C9BAB|nr:AAA family ATPase [uncultured Megasphaera sp.]
MGLFKQAVRQVAKLRLALSGPSGSGKTYSALLIASGIVPMEKVAVIDTENGSANLYANLGTYSVLTLHPPYTPKKYIEAIRAAEQEGFELVIIDSLSHAWNGEGGLLEQKDKATDAKYKGNGWAAWREVTPEYNKLIETMLNSPCHIIATMRAKTEYMQDDSNGRKRIVKVGAAPIQRDGIEYEFTVVFDLSIDHVATVNKDRTRLFDGQYFMPTPDVGKTLKQWLDAGEPAPAPQPVPVTAAQSVPQPTTPQQAPQPSVSSQPVQPAPQPAVPAQPVQPAAASVAPVQPQPSVDTQSDVYLMELLKFVWTKGGWSMDILPEYASKRWGKPFDQITASEVYALTNEICQYIHVDRRALEAEFQQTHIPF